MKATNCILFAAAALMLAACSNEDLPGNDPNAPVEIRLTSGLEVQTRAPHDLDTQLKAGEQVHVWVDDAGNVADKELYKDKELTAESNGALTGETMYFPQTGNAVDIYALHGNFGADTDWAESGFWGESITHKVEQDQKTGQPADGYAKSDLVYAKSTGVARNGNPTSVNLAFSHLLSKVEVVLVQGDGKPKIAKVEILNTKLEATFTPDKAGDLKVTASGTENPIEIDTDLTSAADAAGTDESKKNLNEAIIVPQDLTQGTAFIRVTTAEGGELIYRLPEDKTFDPAKKYRFTVTANLTELKVVNAEITDWTPEIGDDDGTAEME